MIFWVTEKNEVDPFFPPTQPFYACQEELWESVINAMEGVIGDPAPYDAICVSSLFITYANDHRIPLEARAMGGLEESGIAL